MTGHLIAQAPAVNQPAASTPAPSGQLAAPRGHRSPFRDRETGDWEYEGQNGKVCTAPILLNPEAGSKFFAKRLPEKSLSEGRAECNCGPFVPQIGDFWTIRLRIVPQCGVKYRYGAMSPLIAIVLLLAAILIICTPFVYSFAYRTSRREISLTSSREDVFKKWRKQQISSLMCLILSCFGFSLFLLGIMDSVEVIFKNNKMSTSLLGISLSVLSFAIWWRNLEA